MVITMPAEKILTEKGKEELFKALEEYVATVVLYTLFPKKHSKELKEAKENLKAKIKALRIVIQ